MRALLSRCPAFAPLDHYIAGQVSVAEEQAIALLAPGDLLVFGGGPIVDDTLLVKWRSWFQWARRVGARTMIAGCGVGGPLHPNSSVTLAESLFSLTDVAVLRNTPAASFDRALQGRWRSALDPAFLCYPLLAPLVRAKKQVLAINVRTLWDSGGFGRDSEASAAVENVLSYLQPLARWARLEAITPFSCWEQETTPDSVLSNRAAAVLAGQLGIPTHAAPSVTMTAVVDALSDAEYLLSARMHGFIVGLMLGCRAANLDYIEGGGKSSQLYREYLGRDSAPSLFRSGSLRQEDYLLLSGLAPLRMSLEGLCATYASAMREAAA